MNITERLQYIVDEVFGGNKAAFAKTIDIPPTSISNYLSKVRSSKPSSDLLEKIVNSVDINPGWLLTGKGEPFMSSLYDVKEIHNPVSGERKVDNQEITLYDVSASANLQTLFANREQNVLGLISIPNIPKCDGAIYVNGDSMYPLLKSGDIIAYKQIEPAIGNIFFGEMYLLSIDMDGDEYLTVKYVNESEKKDYIKLVSYNTHHPPKDVHLSCINAMALVKLSIRKNTMI